MYNFKGEPCSICNEPFKKGDDVVVCPECGTPYHRECYLKEKRCLFEDKHAQGFEYKPKKEEQQKVRCANCGAENENEALICTHCQSPIKKEFTEDGVNYDEQGRKRVQPNLEKQQNNVYSVLPEGLVNPNITQMFDEKIMLRKYDDISAADWAKFIGKSAPVYLYRFFNMDSTKRKTTFCFSALLFAPFYFLFRKMWFWAIVSIIGSAIVNIPGVISIFQALGLPLFSSITAQSLYYINIACYVLNFAMSIYFGLYAFYLFRQHGVKIIKKLQQSETSVDEYNKKLTKAGAPSAVAVAIYIVIALAISYGFVFLVGAENILALYNLV